MKTNRWGLFFNSIFTFPVRFGHVIDLFGVILIYFGEFNSHLGGGPFGGGPNQFSLYREAVESREMHAEADAGFVRDGSHQNQVHASGGKVGEDAGDFLHVMIINHSQLNRFSQVFDDRKAFVLTSLVVRMFQAVPPIILICRRENISKLGPS